MPCAMTRCIGYGACADVRWAVPLFKGQPVARALSGRFRSVILLGLDDASLAGAPHKMILGSVESLREPDAVIIDLAGYHFLFPASRRASAMSWR